GARRSGEGPGFQVRMPGNEAQEFPARVATGTRHRHPDTHELSRPDRCPRPALDPLSAYALNLLNMQSDARLVRSRPTCSAVMPEPSGTGHDVCAGRRPPCAVTRAPSP